MMLIVLQLVYSYISQQCHECKSLVQLENAAWSKISLKNVQYVYQYDLKKTIKSKMAPKLNSFAAANLILKATNKLDDASQAVELDARDSLLKVLGRLCVK